jgi:inhibitor of cysteine peptidase
LLDFSILTKEERKMRHILMVTLILWVLVIGACAPTPATPEASEDMPNPASKHCADQGYTLEIRSEAGGEVGYCLFPDGTECEEWAFFRGECGPGTPKP